ncbi:hypothetical protein COV16_06545 [Candidatus Woesearchaeota archaeon CG10_big_fil_rev_8_21_14_0_10_34_8]|nr:MAG: hypothetical protein COV16_06545 [Candidatus Woesearchaeota archaeon CG10_big_fil_rev_8_21_14_0_10_34_8]
MFEFLLKIHPTILIILVGVIISVIMVFVYKWMTDQTLMKRLKEEIKELQGEMKSLRDNPSKMAEVNKRAMETNMKYMMNSMKPTLVTFIPIILIFGWLNGHIAFDPLIVGQEFSVELEFYEGISGSVIPITPEGLVLINGESYAIKDGIVQLVYRPDVAGSYTLDYMLKSDAGEEIKSWSTDIIVTESVDDRQYVKTPTAVKDKILKKITVSLDKFKPFGSVSIFGWQPGWIALYIIVSLVCSIGLRKLLKVY